MKIVIAIEQGKKNGIHGLLSFDNVHSKCYFNLIRPDDNGIVFLSPDINDDEDNRSQLKTTSLIVHNATTYCMYLNDQAS